MQRLMLCMLFIGLVAGTVQAQVGTLDKRVVPIQSAPLQITNLEAGPQAPAWASQTTWALSTIPHLPVYLQIQNVGQKTAYAYSVMVAAYDPFGDYIDTIRACAVTALAPQVSDVGRWSLPIRYPDVAWTIVCYVESVRFQDGSLWRVDPMSVAALIPSAAPVRFQSWHIVPDPREVLPIKMKDLPTQAATP